MRRLLLVGLLVLVVPGTAGAAPLTVGTGQNGGIAIDDAGTVYVGWQINTYDPGDAVQFCILPARARACASQVTIPFPGQGYNRSRVSVLLPAPNTVDVVVPRTNGRGANSYLARSLDGGRSFGPAGAISGDGFSDAVLGPGGRVALVDGPTTTRAGLFAADGSSVNTNGSELGPFLEGVFTDIAASGEEVLAAGSDASTTHAFRLGAGGDPNQAGAWQQIDPARGEDPQLAGLPGGFAALLEPSDHSPNLFVQRLEGAAWSPPVPVALAGLQLGLHARRQHEGAPHGADHLLGLPPALRDLDGRRGAVVLGRRHRQLRQRVHERPRERRQRLGRRRGGGRTSPSAPSGCA